MKEKKTNVFVRGLSVRNKKFIDRMVRTEDLSIGRVINKIIDKERERVKNDRAERKRTT